MQTIFPKGIFKSTFLRLFPEHLEMLMLLSTPLDKDFSMDIFFVPARYWPVKEDLLDKSFL